MLQSKALALHAIVGVLTDTDKDVRYAAIMTLERLDGVIEQALTQSNLQEDTWSIQHMYYDVRGGREIDPNIAAICRPPITM